MALTICTRNIFRKALDIRNVGPLCQKVSQQDANDRFLPQQQQLQQVRWMSRVKRRHTLQPFWHAQVTRTKYPEKITTENEEFLSEVINEEYAAETSTSPLAAEPWPRGEWAPKSQRCGLIGKKLGTALMWKKDGTRLVTTLIHISDNHVIRYVPASELIKHDHRDDVRRSKKPRGALVVGADSADPRMFTKEYYNMFEKAGVMPKKKLTKFLVTDNAILQPGTPLYANHFRPGDGVDIGGFTIDRGFQGVIRRWGFKGMPAKSGVTKSHRRGGCIGAGRDKVMPGKKMPGHMGMEYRTLRGVKILRINSQFNVIWVLGPIMGAVGDYMHMYDSGLHHLRYRDPANHPAFPTHYPAEDELPEVDWTLDSVQKFSEGTIVFESEEVAVKK